MQSFLHFVLFMGFIRAVRTISSAAAVFCNCKNMTSFEELCKVSEGDHSLSCFGRRTTETITEYSCTWNPGQYHNYFICIKQKKFRKMNTTKRMNTMESTAFQLTENNMTAFAIAQSEDKKTCAFAKFSSHPSNIINCGRPTNVTFSRHHGHLNILAEWEDSNVKHYILKYRENSTTVWKEVKSQNSTYGIVKDLVSFQSYEMQIQCVVTAECPQCPLSNVTRVPQELIAAPVIKETHIERIQSGQRKITVKWEHVQSAAVETYTLTAQKASGELAEQSSYFLNLQVITLFLSYSAYNLSIRALNKAGQSPATPLAIDAMEDQSDLDGTFNVTLNSNNSFRLTWNETLSLRCHCYLVEWWTSNERLSYKTFYVKKNPHTVKTENAEFQDFIRYHFFLHARHEKETCNLKKVNNSDQTYGRTQVYLTEGTPLTAPGNVSISNITQSSFVITWNPVPEADLRGFLQSYVIRYTRDDIEKKNVTVHLSMNSYELLNLKSGSNYCVQLSAFTAAGEGKQSKPKCAAPLDPEVISGMLAGVIAGVLVLLLATHYCFRLLKRSKKLLWPSIPNPYNSNAVQKMEGGHDLEVMNLLCRPNLEETEEHVSVLEVKKDTHSARVVSDATEGNLTPYTSPPGSQNEPPLSPTASTAVDFTPNEAFPVDSNQKGSIEDLPVGANNIKDPPCVLGTESVSTVVANPARAFMSDYTTMELFQQITKTAPPVPSSSGAASTDTGQEYLRQPASLYQKTTESSEQMGLTDHTENQFP